MSYDVEKLARYNSEVARGIVHTDEWKAKMAAMQKTFNLTHYGVEDPIPGKLYSWPPTPGEKP
jgi:hypothetical protein